MFTTIDGPATRALIGSAVTEEGRELRLDFVEPRLHPTPLMTRRRRERLLLAPSPKLLQRLCQDALQVAWEVAPMEGTTTLRQARPGGRAPTVRLRALTIQVVTSSFDPAANVLFRRSILRAAPCRR